MLAHGTAATSVASMRPPPQPASCDVGASRSAIAGGTWTQADATAMPAVRRRSDGRAGPGRACATARPDHGGILNPFSTPSGRSFRLTVRALRSERRLGWGPGRFGQNAELQH